MNTTYLSTLSDAESPLPWTTSRSVAGPYGVTTLRTHYLGGLEVARGRRLEPLAFAIA
jgi:hypothetical protein